LKTLRLCLMTTAAAFSPVIAHAQEEPEEAEIVVTGQAPRGSVVGDIKPELTLNPGDVRALGVSNVTELLAELAPQLASGRGGGQPVVLLEGRRISGFREVATLPAEAIARVDILPEEVALKYGYAADQKVVNIVLRQRFRAFTLEADARAATAGGAFNPEGSFDFLRIYKGGRFNINAEYETTGRLRESQRGIVNAAGQQDSRTLLPAEQQFKLTATLNRALGNELNWTLNGELTTDATRGWFGRPGASLTLPGGAVVNPVFTTLLPLERSVGTQTGYAATTLNGDIGKWRWTFTGNYTRTDSKTLIDRGIDPTLLQAAITAGDPAANLALPLAPQFTALRAADQARSASDVAIADFIISGSPLAMPAGDVNTTVKMGAQFSDFESSALRGGVASSGGVARDIGNGQINIDVPLTSRRADVLPVIGDLSINGNAAIQRLSDYGTLKTYGYGANWTPVKGIGLIGSFTDEDGAPTPQQIGNPVIALPGVQVFDFVTGRNAIVTQTSGGNTNLLPSNRRTWKLGLNLKPFAKPDISLQADFVRTRTTNGIAALPPASAASQAAFANRYTRDAGGNLIAVDARTVNFAEAERSQLRWGINFSKAVKNSQAQTDALRALFRERFPNGPTGGPGAGRPGGEARGPGGGGGRSFGGGRGPGGGGGGRLNLALYHTLHLTDTVTLRDGLPVIDLLNGGVIGSGGGQPRHEVEFQAGLAKDGFGSRLTANWQSATRVTGATVADDLRFSDLATVNFRLFANLAQMPSIMKSAPWLRGTRITIGVNNLFDTRQRVTDGTGATPLAYQPGYLDPLGRTIRISIRKVLF
jgi:iron complex outermembrane recepter protein